MMESSAPSHAIAALAAGVTFLAIAPSATARPEAPAALCRAIPEAAVCAGQVPRCSLCHDSTDPVSWNDFGKVLIGPVSSGSSDEPYDDALSRALLEVQAGDADQDGLSNIAEIYAGTSPADPLDGWCATPADPEAALPLGRSDVARAYRRASITFCGVSPSYEASLAFAELGSEEARYEALHVALEDCLHSTYWRDVALPRLGDEKIRPIFVYGPNSPATVALANYHWDYRLFAYVLLDHRDARDMLLAEYHVDRAEDGELFPVEGILGRDIEPQQFGFPGGQPLAPEYRAGMLTTQWFLTYNTFLSALPRGTAAQAYRAFLDLDIAKLEGISPVADEPLDVDDRGVDASNCAQCHSTLDPLAYAFMPYEGVPMAIGSGMPGTYNPQRGQRRIPGWSDPQAWLFGEPIGSVREWAALAANSEAFASMLGTMFFAEAFDREPSARERAELTACWRALPDEGWSANALIHCIVDIPTFAPRTQP